MDLRAAPLEGRSLGAALNQLVGEQTGTDGLAIRFRSSGSSRQLPVWIEAGLYRIAQEALSNVIQHAEARRAMVELIISPTEARLVVEDDGRGFEPSAVPAGRFGLMGINERVKLLGGRLRVESEIGQGTRLEVTVSL
jgi:two-component system NarL family sensor kinase